jgi:hypothetical protein
MSFVSGCPGGAGAAAIGSAMQVAGAVLVGRADDSVRRPTLIPLSRWRRGPGPLGPGRVAVAVVRTLVLDGPSDLSSSAILTSWGGRDTL